MMYKLIVFAYIVIIAEFVESVTYNPSRERLDRVTKRWNAFKTSINAQSGYNAREEICGKLTQDKCTTIIGRPGDEEADNCDRFCCHMGYRIGWCSNSINVVKVALAIIGIAKDVISGDVNTALGAVSGIKDGITTKCSCSNDKEDALCGPDGTFLNITCPDLSACKRKCCRNEKDFEGAYCKSNILCICPKI